MGLRPGHCYRSAEDRPYTRVALKVPRRNYVGAAPQLKTRQFNMGNPTKRYHYILDLIADETVQVRDNALESSRVIINRYLNNKIGKDNFFMRIRTYPHHILRENKQAQGAGSDRISQGMSRSFGKPIGRAARVRAGKPLVSVLVNESHVEIAKKALMRANARMPLKVHVSIGTNVSSIGTLPRKVREAEAAEKGAAPAAAAEAEKAGEEGKEEKKGEAKAEKKGEQKAEAKAEQPAKKEAKAEQKGSKK